MISRKRLQQTGTGCLCAPASKKCAAFLLHPGGVPPLEPNAGCAPYFGMNSQQRPFQTVFSKGTRRHGFARKAECHQVALQQARVGGDVGSGLGSLTGMSPGDGCSGNSGGGRSAGRGGTGRSGFGTGGVSGSGGHPGGVGTAPAPEGVNPRFKAGGIKIDRTLSRQRRRPKSFALCAAQPISWRISPWATLAASCCCS